MAKLIFLGTASSIPTKTRDNTSFVFSHKNLNLLVDCPGSIPQKLLKANIDFKSLKDLVITHRHPDHISGIISLIHTQYKFNPSLNIFTNSACIKIIKKLLTMFDLNKKSFPKINYVNVFSKKIFFSKRGVQIQAIKNKHTNNSFGIKISFSNKTIFYSSDTSFSPGALKKAGPVNYLIHDCTASSSYFNKYPRLYRIHTCANTLAEYLKNKPKTKLIPIHFLLLRKGEEKRISKELHPIKRQVIMPEDFKVLPL